jgi:hypothetical protein
MGLQNDYDDGASFSDFNYEDDIEELDHKKQVRRMLEERLERKRLKQELDDELEGEFDWDDVDK